MGLLVYLLSIILVFNLMAQGSIGTQKKLNLTSLSKNLICRFIQDDMNKERIDSLSSSIVLSFGDTSEADVDLNMFDEELLYSCLNRKLITKHLGYCIFYQGKINSKYVRTSNNDYNKSNCSPCDSLIRSIPDKSSVIYKYYDGSVYKIYKSDKGNKMRIVKIPGG